ncbi:hypothetical protein [Thermodesulfovibrio hydrogeniphilus]
MDTRYLVTEEELKRFEVMTQVLNGSMTLRQAQEILGLSYRQLLRIKKKLVCEGF